MAFAMRVLLTGGTGYVGSFLVRELLSRGHELTILGREPHRHPHFLGLAKVTLVAGSLEDPNTVEPLLPGHEACIHNAVIWHDEEAERQLLDLRCARWLFGAAADAGIEHMIYTSSTAVHRPFKPVMSERDVLAPTDEYGASKVSAEAFLWATSHRNSMRCNVIRSAPVVGVPPYDGVRANADRRFDQFLDKARAGEDITVAGADGRQFIAGEDLAKVFSELLDSQLNREVFLAVANDFVTWQEIGGWIVEDCGSHSQVRLSDHAMPHRFDCAKIEQHFGLKFEARTAVRALIRHMIASS